MDLEDVHSLKEGDLESREENVNLLLSRAEHDDASAIATLRTVVRDYRDFHRSIYCRALNRIEIFGDADLEEPLLAALADTRYNCQAWAATGCTVLGIRAAVAALLDLVDHSQWIVRARAIVGLGVLGDETVVGALAPLLHDPTDWVRHRAADALATIGGDEALAALWAEFAHRRYERIGYIASALAQFAPAVIPRLIDAATSTDPDQRYWAATALGSTGDERAIPTLTRLAVEDQGTTVFDGWVSVSAKKGLRTCAAFGPPSPPAVSQQVKPRPAPPGDDPAPRRSPGTAPHIQDEPDGGTRLALRLPLENPNRGTCASSAGVARWARNQQQQEKPQVTVRRCEQRSGVNAIQRGPLRSRRSPAAVTADTGSRVPAKGPPTDQPLRRLPHWRWLWTEPRPPGR